MTDDVSWDGETRRIDADMLRDHLGDDLGSLWYMVAGPPAMAEAIGETLGKTEHPEQIQVGRFSGY